MADKILPPLPPSDEESIMKNAYDGNNNTRARSFWGDNEIIRIEDKPIKKCEHLFKKVPTGVECKRCHFGLIGFFEIHNEKVFSQGKPLGI